MTGPALTPAAVPAKRPQASRVLYLGPKGDEFCSLLSAHVGSLDVSYFDDVQAALQAARARIFDTVLVDQRDRSLATKLILPLIAGLGYEVKLVVISPFSDVSHYLAIPGVARVLSAPLREGQLLRILGLKPRTPRGDAQKPQGDSRAHAAGSQPLPAASAAFMSVVSGLYKRAAFALLLALFLAFTFYGILIGYFLLSSSWGAPMTLTRGHELVNKAERDLTEMEVALNQTEQRLSEIALEKDTAERGLVEARSQVTTAIGTVTHEMELRRKQVALLKKSVKRYSKVRADLARQLGKGGIGEEMKALYGKRLITKKTYTSNALGVLEAEQRLAAIDNDMEEATARQEEMEASVALLASLREALHEGGAVDSLRATSPDLLLLTKQAVEARTSELVALSRIATTDTTRVQLERNRKVLAEQIATVKLSAVGRAIHQRIDVVFVPYTNDRRFAEGAKLYSCLLTIIWCSDSGQAGKALPGEVAAVHPFFGKPIRGYFVEAARISADAATREIIHGTRAPFFL